MRGIGLTHALADVSGLAFDRIFKGSRNLMVRLLPLASFPQMVRFTPSPVHDGLHLTAPDGSSAYVRFADFATQDAPTEVWGHTFYRAELRQTRSTNGYGIFVLRSAVALGGANK
ncbi:MOSC N-terminal beta barrel domain-containing protein [Escherichia coli]|nr:MOSC N-terminal beta barrel domain-containing protein [Escherichia coli]